MYVTMWRNAFSKLCECVNAFFWCVCVGLSVFLCFCSVSVCGQAIHQSVDSTARRITFPLSAHIPLILPFYLTPHSVPPDAPPYPASSLSPTQSAIVAIIITCFCHWTEMSHTHTANVFLCKSGISHFPKAAFHLLLFNASLMFCRLKD